MSTRDRRSQRIREQLRAHANPRSGPALESRSLQEQLKRVYLGDPGGHNHLEPVAVAVELARLSRRRR